MKNLKFNYLGNSIFKKSFISMSFILALFNSAAFGSESDFTVIDPPFMFTTFNHKLNVGNLPTKEITLDYKVSRKENVVYAAGANENDEINGYTLNVELSGIATSSDNYVVNLIGGMSKNNDALSNTINITKMPSTITRDIRIFGADSWKGNTNFNKVNIDSIQTNINKLYIVGGRSTDENKGDSSNNTINISSSKLISDNTNFDFQITGGIAQGKAQNNEVIINNSEIINTMLISGGASYGDPDKIQLGTEKNRVKITSSKVKGAIFGGDSAFLGFDNDANKNEVEIISSKISKQDNFFMDFVVVGGASTNNATNNTVSIVSSSINGDSYGGLSTTALGFGGGEISGNANKNAINITSSNINGKIYGGKSEEGAANNNKVSLKISKVGSSVAGGSAKHEANNNILDITSSDIGGDVYGGYSSESTAINNTVNLFHNSARDLALGKHFLVKGVIHGGFSGGSKEAISGNKLNVTGKNLIAGNIKNFSEVNFNLPKDIKTNDIVLQLTNDEDTVLNSVKVNPYVEQGKNEAVIKNLKPGQKIYIIKKASIDGSTLEEKQAIDKKLLNKTISEVGASAVYDVALNQDKSNLFLEVSKNALPKTNPRLNHTLIPNLASSHVVNQMSDLMSDNIPNIAMLDNNVSANTDNIISFGYVKGYKSNIGKSDTDVNGAIVDVGIASRADNALMGGFFEYSYADYDGSINSYKNDGKIKAYAVGALARFDLRITSL